MPCGLLVEAQIIVSSYRVVTSAHNLAPIVRARPCPTSPTSVAKAARASDTPIDRRGERLWGPVASRAQWWNEWPLICRTECFLSTAAPPPRTVRP
jgi:hypothetical protein